MKMEKTIFSVNRLKLPYLSKNVLDKYLYLSEIDYVSLSVFKSNLLFSFLKAKGYSSVLINSFADQECSWSSSSPSASNRVYKFVCSISGSMEERVFFKHVIPSAMRQKGLSWCDLEEHHLDLIGGEESLNIIKSLDPYFLGNLSRAMWEGYCDVRRVDLCMDCNMDLMEQISIDVSGGCATSFGGHLRGYGRVHGDRFSGEMLGYGSKIISSIKKVSRPNKRMGDLSLNTLYGGHPRFNEHFGVIYNKRKDLINRRYSVDSEITRFEMRLQASSVSTKRKRNGSLKKLMNFLFDWVVVNKDMDIARTVQHLIFTCLLFSHWSFDTRRKMSARRRFSCINKVPWCGWFRDVFDSCVSIFFDETSLGRSILKVNKQEFFQSLSKYRSNPSAILDIFNPAFVNHLYIHKGVYLNQDVSLFKEEVQDKNKRGRPLGKKDSYKRKRGVSSDSKGGDKVSNKRKVGRPLGSKDSYKRKRNKKKVANG